MNKKLLISLLFILLTGWIAGSCYWYICKVRKNCETELVKKNNDITSNKDSLTSKTEAPKIEKPSFSIKDGDVTISKSSSNISFGSGTAEIKIPDSMKSELNNLADYLKNNPNKNLKINGLYSQSDNSDSIGMARANSMASYFENDQGISPDRMITSASVSDALYTNEETHQLIGGLEYEIVANEATIIEEEKQIEETTIAESASSSNVDPSLQRRVKRRQIMYYPLTHFEVEPTYALEKYFKNLKKYFDQNPDGLVQITGHTEFSEEASLNKFHSKKYAEKVKNYLISEYEMNPRNFRVKGRGHSRPVTDSDTDLGKAENRRIEFSFIK